MARFTIFGASGFIGRHLATALERQGNEVARMGRGDGIPPCNLSGHGIYCIGMTADFRIRPYDTARAHIGVLTDVLEAADFESFLYLSSTRVYAGAETTQEDTPLAVRPAIPDQLYNVTKLAGEALCLAVPNPAFRVVRLSNVIGPDDGVTNFLPSLIADARRTVAIELRTTPDSAKDYIAVADAVTALTAIALHGRHRLYNVASGRNVSNAEVAALLEKRFAARINYRADAVRTTYPRIDTSRLSSEFGFDPMPFADAFDRATSERNETP